MVAGSFPPPPPPPPPPPLTPSHRYWGRMPGHAPELALSLAQARMDLGLQELAPSCCSCAMIVRTGEGCEGW